MSVSFTGLLHRSATFLGDGVEADVPVKLSAAKTVTAAASGDRFIGIAGEAKNGIVPVQLRGYVIAKYSGTAPAIGYQKLAAGANGTVATNAAGGEYLVLEVNTSTKTVGFML